MSDSFEGSPLRGLFPSCIVLGIVGALVLGAAPGAVATPVKEQAVPAPRFVQEGTPVDVGGQAMPWDAGLGLKVIGDTSYAWELPAGVTHTAISVGAVDNTPMALMLRSDGEVVASLDDAWSSPPEIPELPDGERYTAVAAGHGGASFLLRSDGELVMVLDEELPTPHVPELPSGMSYVAVDVGQDGAFAVRSDGRIVGIKVAWAEPRPLTCADAFVPPAGLKYTAISADDLSWAALRSDGAIVFCRWANDVAEVVAPSPGNRFTGLDIAPGLGIAEDYGYAVRDDGVIVGLGAAVAPALVPVGRTVVGLSAHDRGGAAVLDDGTMLTWGREGSAPQPDLPGAGLVAVADWYNTTWLIRQGAAIPVDLQVASSTTVNYNEPTPVEINVTAGGLSPSGSVRIGYVRDDGSMWWGFPERVVDGRATFEFREFPEGVYPRVVRFDGPPFVTTERSVDFVVRPQQPSTITVDMPEKWRIGADDVYVSSHVEASGGVTTDQGYFTVTAEESGERLGASGPDGRQWIDTTVLPPGRHQVRVDYVSDGPAAPVSWTGTVTVVPPAETRITVDTELTAEYGAYSTLLQADMTVSTVDGSRLPLGYLYVYDEDGNSLYSAGGRSGQGTGSIEYSTSLRLDEMPPGDHPILIRWVPDSSFSNPTAEVLPAEWRGNVRIAKASTRILIDPLSAGVYGQDRLIKVGIAATNLSDVHGTVLAKIDGVEVGRAEIAVDTPEAPVVSLPIRMSGVLPGVHRLEISYLGSELLKPASAAWQLEVRSAEFTTPFTTVSGTPRIGATLTADPGVWSPKPTSVTYVWKADGEVIAGATSSSLVIPGSALGKRITVSATGSRTYYTSRTVTSIPTEPVVSGVFSASRSPSVAGTVQVGKTLTANRWTWTPTPTTVKYQWRLDGKAVSGATSKTWTVPASAKGKKVSVAITGSKTGYTTKTLASPATAAVKAGVFVAPATTITGTVKVGSTLKAVRGTWTPQPSTVKYQWKVGGVAVKGATNYFFKVPASAKGKRVAVVVTGSRTGYTTKTVTSALTSVVR
ncbi:hypothetical protein [Promicromonospora sp. NPDC050262]|uniref:hypothetical protein n=1 Tax=Promicromonospora sp. NPDC050262 TaxID=3155036 RepID=UPI003406BB3B